MNSTRIRTRGGRRREADEWLVRSRPASALVKVPPISLPGQIARVCTCQAISDYAGISTSAWSSGATGDLTTPATANTSMNCLYKYYTTTNMRTISKTWIMDPIRWSFGAPASNGGQYDWWDPYVPATGTYKHTGGDNVHPWGEVGISNKALPSGGHGGWTGGKARANPFNLFPKTWRYYPLFESLAPSTPYWTVDTFNYLTFKAIQHRVNGSAVGSTIIDPPNWTLDTSDWYCGLGPDDYYEIDIWYQINSTASLSFSAVAGKAWVFFPQSMVFNSSKRIWSGPPYYLNLSNADFSPSFNYTLQTYEVTIAGHSGYTLKGGSNGPHKMVTDATWTATINNGNVVWKKTTNNDHVAGISIWWDREIAFAEISMGPLRSGGCPATVALYRIDDGNTKYRTSVASTDYGTMTCAKSGLFSQSGTSVFSLVGWTVGNSSTSNVAVDGQAPDGFVSYTPSTYTDFPTTMTFTRVHQ